VIDVGVAYQTSELDEEVPEAQTRLEQCSTLRQESGHTARSRRSPPAFPGAISRSRWWNVDTGIPTGTELLVTGRKLLLGWALKRVD
jgi:hypothetical protein